MDLLEVFNQFGIFGGLALIAMLSILTGGTYTRGAYKSMEKDRDSYRKSFEDQRLANITLATSLDNLVNKYGKTMNHFINSLPTPFDADNTPDDGDET